MNLLYGFSIYDLVLLASALIMLSSFITVGYILLSRKAIKTRLTEIKYSKTISDPRKSANFVEQILRRSRDMFYKLGINISNPKMATRRNPRTNNKTATQVLLNTAGLYAPRTVYIFIGIRVFVGATVSFLAFLAIYVFDYWLIAWVNNNSDAFMATAISFLISEQNPLIMNLSFILLAGFIASLMPEYILRIYIRKRLNKISQSFPDSLDLIVLCTQAGLSIDAAIEKISTEMSEFAPQISQEFSFLLSEMRIYDDRTKPFKNLQQRLKIDSITAFTNTIIQTIKYGTSISSTLRVLAEDLRTARQLRAEENAAKLPVYLTIPLVVCFVPVLWIIILGPAVLDIMDVLRP